MATEVRRGARRLTTETKSAFKTTEFWAYVLIFLLILIAGNSIEGEEGGADYFGADRVWLYITLLTIGYMISRGLAKSGVDDPYTDTPDTRGAEGAPITERVKQAATVLREGQPSATERAPGAYEGPGGTTRAP